MRFGRPPRPLLPTRALTALLTYSTTFARPRLGFDFRTLFPPPSEEAVRALVSGDDGGWVRVYTGDDLGCCLEHLWEIRVM
jgi:hypothetical protein